MHEHRIYIPPAHLRGDSVQLEGGEAHYLLHVLRMKEGDEVTAFDGEGRSCRAVVTVTGRDFAIVRVGSMSTIGKPIRRFAVAQAVLKSGAMDTVVQKCTELGADRIIGFFAERGVARGRGDPGSRRMRTRWTKAAIEACRQCRRDFVPEIELLPDTVSLAETAAEFDGIAMGSLKETRPPLLELLSGGPLSGARRILLVVGPEGDLTPRETDILGEAGALPCALSDSVLRAETAAITAAAITGQFFLARNGGREMSGE